MTARRGRPSSTSATWRQSVANHQTMKIAARMPSQAPVLIAPWLSAKNELIFAVDSSGDGGEPGNTAPTIAKTTKIGPPISAYLCHLLSFTVEPPFFGTPP